MKQTQNALKFLLAQYRAIFKHAYVKGLATAAIVTAGLTVGQAQATEVYHYTNSIVQGWRDDATIKDFKEFNDSNVGTNLNILYQAANDLGGSPSSIEGFNDISSGAIVYFSGSTPEYNLDKPVNNIQTSTA